MADDPQEANDVGAPDLERQYPLPPSTVDGRIYTDQARYDREFEKIFMNSWFPVCPSWDVLSPREYVIWDRIDQSVVIARQDDGSIAAWHNVCQHRGARLVSKSGTCRPGKFACPWHGFVYNLKGEVTGVPLRESFDPATLKGLKAPPVRVTEWSGFIWLTFSDTAPELKDYLGDLHTELETYGLDQHETRYRVSVEFNANWKLVVDAFNETWHVPFTHTGTIAGLVMWRDACLKICPPHSWMTLPVKDFSEQVKKDGGDYHAANICHHLVFPNTIFSCFPSHLQMWTTWPVSPTKTIVDAYGIIGPTPPGMTPEQWAKQNERDWTQFLNVVGEDALIINNIDSVCRSKAFGKFLFNRAEGRLTSFHEQVDRLTG